MGFASVEMHCLAVILKWLPLFGHHCTKQPHTVAPTLNSLRFTCTLSWLSLFGHHCTNKTTTHSRTFQQPSKARVPLALLHTGLHMEAHLYTGLRMGFASVEMHCLAVMLKWPFLFSHHCTKQPDTVAPTLNGLRFTCTLGSIWA